MAGKIAQPGVFVGKDKTGKILYVTQAHLAYLAHIQLNTMAARVGRTLTSIHEHKRSKP